MPLEMIEVTDQLTGLITFKTSPVYEMIISLRTLLQSSRHADWVARMRETLPPAFWDELHDLYEPYHNGVTFFELAIDYPDQEDVPGFIEYVRNMDPVDFMFYLVGRILSRDEIAATGLDPERLDEVLRQSPNYMHSLCLHVPMERILADVPAFQRRLADFWAWYWADFFAMQVKDIRPHWQHSLNEKMVFLTRNGGAALMEHITNKRHLPEPLPADQPIREVVFIPLYLIPIPVYLFYGYGNVTVMFDCTRTEARLAEIELHKNQALAAFKALSDSTRLTILRAIANSDRNMHGKKLAEYLDLSPSAVSRHLAQLRDAKLVVEETHPDRTITYQIQPDRIQALPQELLDYLYH